MTPPKGNDYGKKSKVENKKLVDALCQNIMKGMPYRHACAAAGISYSTYRDWIRRGEAEMQRVDENPKASIRKDEAKYVDFVQSIREAEAVGMKQNLDRIADASKNGAWQASAWLLERRYPDEFGRKEKLDMKAEHSRGIKIELKSEDCGE
jgi:transposase